MKKNSPHIDCQKVENNLEHHFSLAVLKKLTYFLKKVD